MDVVINEQGQILVPQEIRDQLGLRAGSLLQLETQDGTIVVRRKIGENSFEEWRGRGVAPSGETSTDAYLNRIRDDHSG